MSTEADQRQLKIKTGTVRRLRKELGMYSEEVSRGTAKVALMREEGADPYDIKYEVRRPGRRRLRYGSGAAAVVHSPSAAAAWHPP